MEVKGKKVLVFGLGISGIGAGKILERQGAEVVLYDGNKKLMEEKVRQQSGADSNAKIIIGEFPDYGYRRGGACLSVWKRRCSCYYRNERQDDYNYTSW